MHLIRTHYGQMLSETTSLGYWNWSDGNNVFGHDDTIVRNPDSLLGSIRASGHCMRTSDLPRSSDYAYRKCSGFKGTLLRLLRGDVLCDLLKKLVNVYV